MATSPEGRTRYYSPHTPDRVYRRGSDALCRLRRLSGASSPPATTPLPPAPARRDLLPYLVCLYCVCGIGSQVPGQVWGHSPDSRVTPLTPPQSPAGLPSPSWRGGNPEPSTGAQRQVGAEPAGSPAGWPRGPPSTTALRELTLTPPSPHPHPTEGSESCLRAVVETAA